jgi:hypothetical protein
MASSIRPGFRPSSVFTGNGSFISSLSKKITLGIYAGSGSYLYRQAGKYTQAVGRNRQAGEYSQAVGLTSTGKQVNVRRQWKEKLFDCLF